MSDAVALILDPEFGDKLEALAQRMPVWVVSSPLNDRAVANLRPRLAEGRLTTLLKRANESAANELSRALIAIDDHHGDRGGAGSFQAIEVYGASKFPPEELCSELGFRTVGVTGYGFRVQR